MVRPRGAQREERRPPQSLRLPKRMTSGLPGGASRGALLLTGAKLWFLVSGYALVFALARLLRREGVGEFGDYRVVAAVVNPLNAVLITGTLQAVSRFVAADPARTAAVRAAAWRVQAGLALLLGGGLFLGAPALARFLHDDALAPRFRLVVPVVVAYAFYAVEVGTLNGRRRFAPQAALDVTFSTLKLAAMIALAALGFGVEGALIGFSIAAVAILPVSMALARPREGERVGPPCASADLFRFQAALLAFTLGVSLFLHSDLFLVKRLASGDRDAAAAWYSAAQDLARAPYQALVGGLLALFPVTARAAAAGDRAEARRSFEAAARYGFLFVLGTETLLAADPRGAVRVLFPERFLPAASALPILSGAMAVFALFMIAATAVTGLGRGRLAAAMAGTTLVVSVACGALLVPRLGRSGAALGALAGASAGLLWAGSTVARLLGARLRPGTLCRAAVAAGVVWAGGRLLPSGGALFTLAKFSLLLLVYGGVLTLLGEWTDEDRRRARQVLGRGAPRPAEAARA